MTPSIEFKQFEKDIFTPIEGIMPEPHVLTHKDVKDWVFVDCFVTVPNGYNETVWRVASLVKAYKDIERRISIELATTDTRTYTILDGNIIASYDGLGVRFDTYKESIHAYQLNVGFKDIRAKYARKAEWDSVIKSLDKNVKNWRDRFTLQDVAKVYTDYKGKPSRFGLTQVKALDLCAFNRNFEYMKSIKSDRDRVPRINVKASKITKEYLDRFGA